MTSKPTAGVQHLLYKTSKLSVTLTVLRDLSTVRVTESLDALYNRCCTPPVGFDVIIPMRLRVDCFDSSVMSLPDIYASVCVSAFEKLMN